MNTAIVIIDTNVPVAGLITSQPNSPRAQILEGMLDGSIFFFFQRICYANIEVFYCVPGLLELTG